LVTINAVDEGRTEINLPFRVKDSLKKIESYHGGKPLFINNCLNELVYVFRLVTRRMGREKLPYAICSISINKAKFKPKFIRKHVLAFFI